MKTDVRISSSAPETLAKRMVYLAWKASSVQGMGFLQDRGPDVSEDEVWDNGQMRGDYPGAARPIGGSIYCDYVFGRMMKLGLKWDDEAVIVSSPTVRRDYQSWCGRYADYDALADAANASLSDDR